MLRSTTFLVTLYIALVAGSVHAAPCAGFDDVDDATGPTAGFCADVTWIRNRGVTLGCTATQYCPFQFVSRIQMAAFMHRLGEALFPSTCAPGSVMKWNGTTWACASDNGGGSGTVTSVAAGTGLQGSPNPITGAGSLNLASSYQLPQACTNGQVAKSNGAGGWTCAADNGSGTVTSVATGTGLTGGPITTTGTIAVNTATIQARVTGTCGAGSSIRTINADGSVVCEMDDNSAANAFVQNGNAFGTTAVLGTTDAQPVEIIVNGARVMHYSFNAISPNIVGGDASNSAEFARGATIAGGGTLPEFFNPDPNVTGEGPNIVYDAYGTIGGGLANVVGNAGSILDQAFATIGGGKGNTANASYATVGGGLANTVTGFAGAIGGGESNLASGNWSTIGGGFDNNATATGATVAGGRNNTASGLYSAILGGRNNLASGEASMVFGQGNTASGRNSLVGGVNSRADADECVVFGLWGATGAQMNCLGTTSIFRIGAPNGFSVDFGTQRPDGGGEKWVYIGNGFNGRTIDTWNGAHLTDGGVWVSNSDMDRKDGFAAIDAIDILGRVVALPMSSWNYKAEGAHVRHIGPMAQDFHAAFGLGRDDKAISSVDASGVALAAIQGLHAMLRERDAEIAALKAKLAKVVARLEGSTRVAVSGVTER